VLQGQATRRHPCPDDRYRHECVRVLLGELFLQSRLRGIRFVYSGTDNINYQPFHAGGPAMEV
jgi:hypothetical protein